MFEGFLTYKSLLPAKSSRSSKSMTTSVTFQLDLKLSEKSYFKDIGLNTSTFIP